MLNRFITLGCLVAALLFMVACSDTPEDTVEGPSIDVRADSAAVDAGTGPDIGQIDTGPDAEPDTGPIDTGPPPCQFDEDCADDNPCTLDTCNEDGTCTNKPLKSGDGCDDHSKCTADDICLKDSESAPLKCIGVLINCEDGNPCTMDTCDKYAGCKHVKASDNSSCDDGNQCTEGDLCWGGSCLPGLPKKCADSGPCVSVACDNKKGCVKHYADGACDDNNPCTVGDACKKVDETHGECTFGKQKTCDDGNVCTNDDCDSQYGCQFTDVLNGQKCDDGDGCTKVDSCNGGVCKGGAQEKCDDNNQCTTDKCLSPAGECAYDKKPFGTPCNDGNACTNYAGQDTCSSAGECVGLQKSCDDGLPCTVDSCDKGTGACTNTPSNGACDDNNPCTVDDKCVKAACIGVEKVCNDNNICTLDDCKSASGGCTFINKDGLACNDGDACSLSDGCVQGQCKGASYINCGDSNDCTQDECNKVSGCKHTSLNGTPCDDGNVCTSAEVCNSGKCVGKALVCNDGDPCTKDFCNDKGVCDKTVLTCDDNSICTVDSCNNGNCVFTPDPKGVGKYACDDGNVCTDVGVCNAKGKCEAQVKACDDYNPCTKDLCDPQVAWPGDPCVHICDSKQKDQAGMQCVCP